MEKPQSLVELLGTDELSPSANIVDVDNAQTFAQAVLTSREFRQFIITGLQLGELAPGIVVRLMDYAWGKPVECVEVKDTTDRLDDLTPSQLRKRLAERISTLETLVNLLDAPDAPTEGTIH